MEDTELMRNWLHLLTEIADAGDSIARSWFRNRALAAQLKPDQSPVTEADQSIERAARDIAKRREPALAVFGEEYGETPGGGDMLLIIDPIDGTRNFLRGIPIFATLLAIEKSGELIAGLVSAPALGIRWQAARGEGATRNGERIQVSKIDRIARAQCFLPGLGGSSEPRMPDAYLELARSAERSRGFGDFYQHILVAEGAGETSLDVGLKPWDIAALQIIVEEAGGRATGIDGRRDFRCGSLVCSNGILHESVLSVLR